MEAKIMGLRKLFYDFPVSYRIPQFQRPYAWDCEQWEALWGDVRKIADRIVSSPTSDEILPHFMGAIVLQEAEAPFGEARRVLVVDGQQRLTTLQLLLKAMQNAFRSSMSDTRQADDLNKFLLNDYSRAGGDYLNETKIRQSNSLDQGEFQDVIRGRLDEHRTPRSVAEACGYFHREITQWLNKDIADVQLRADALYKAAIDHLKMATITLDAVEKPHFIFEILNTRGELLQQADHIKNTVMYEADVVDDAQKAQQLWGTFESDDWWRRNDRRGRDQQINIDRFLNYWMMMLIGENITMNRVAAEFRSYIDREKPDIEQVASDIREAGIIYRRIEENQLPGIEEFLRRVKTMEIGVIMPPLLWLYTQNISDGERQRSIRALESYLVRRMLCNIRSQGLNRFFIELVRNLDSNKREGQRVDEAVIRFLNGRQEVENRMWPDDRRVVNYLTTQVMPGNPARRKMVFEAIETKIRSEFAEPLGSTAKLTVEHLMPQSWREGDWPLRKSATSRDDAEAERRDYVNVIGNLTLATGRLNSSMSNRSWEDKKKSLNSHSSLFLNKDLLDNSPANWDEDAIEKRSQRLAQEIISIWPHADGI